MNRILYADDCLNVLNDPDRLPDESVDLIYLDPPFNSNSTYNLPFKSKDKTLKPVAAFEDTWRWVPEDDGRLAELERNPSMRHLAIIVKYAQEVEQPSGGGKLGLASYLLNMALRLYAMKRALKRTGSIYLHCDPYAGHYLKLLMDGIYGRKNFRNEIVWCYKSGGVSNRYFARKHDMILFYSKNNPYKFNVQKVKSYGQTGGGQGGKVKYYKDKQGDYSIVNARDWWEISMLSTTHSERLGYPTQKPLTLLERIVKSSSNLGDTVLDPFCGCGTTAHSAELLGRHWIGIDISPFSTELVRERIVGNFRHLNKDDIRIIGVPETLYAVQALAAKNKFEFEKWVCGAIGAHGMYHNPGDRGADGGVDGVMEIDVVRNAKVQREFAIIQVKGGNVTPDSVKALSETVRRLDAVAGIMVCFENQMRTVNNQRSQETWSDDYETYPVIQGYSVESLLDDLPLQLPRRYGNRRGGKISRNMFI